MEACFNYLMAVVQFWTNWMDSAMRLATNPLAVTFAPRPNILIHAPASTDQTAEVKPQVWDVGKAAPLFDLSNVRFFSTEILIVLDPSLDPGRSMGRGTPVAVLEPQRQSGSVAKRDGNSAG
jgi:hypothetical protein